MLKTKEATSNRERARLFAQEHDGERCSLMDSLTVAVEDEPTRLVPLGWEIDGRLGDEFWENLSEYSMPLPLKPSNEQFLSRHRKASKEARDQFEELRSRFEKDVTMVLIPDDETFEGFSIRPVAIEDLSEERKADPFSLLDESMELIEKGRYLEADSKRHAFMLLTGAVDTK